MTFTDFSAQIRYVLYGAVYDVTDNFIATIDVGKWRTRLINSGTRGAADKVTDVEGIKVRVGKIYTLRVS